MKKIIIFLGPPGSGKGTQAEKLAEKFDYAHISTGDLLRHLKTTKRRLTAHEKLALQEIESGKLAEDDVIFHLAFAALDKNLKKGKGVILDGAVRSFSQAQKYQEHFKNKKMDGEVIAIEVAIPDEESFRRLAHRRLCKDCGDIVAIDPAQPIPPCPKCGGTLIEREDDHPETVRKRIIKQGNGAIKPIREFYQSLGLFKSVDGTRAVPEVASQIEQALKV